MNSTVPPFSTEQKQTVQVLESEASRQLTLLSVHLGGKMKYKNFKSWFKTREQSHKLDNATPTTTSYSDERKVLLHNRKARAGKWLKLVLLESRPLWFYIIWCEQNRLNSSLWLGISPALGMLQSSLSGRGGESAAVLDLDLEHVLDGVS